MSQEQGYPSSLSSLSHVSAIVLFRSWNMENESLSLSSDFPRYRGNNGFIRRGHLMQHIVDYHKIETYYSGSTYDSPFRCTQAGCDAFTALSTPNPRSLEELTQHMLSKHNSFVFICNKRSCDRVELDGFDTQKLLHAHIKKDHPSPFQCTHPGCDRVESKGWLRERDQIKHIFQKHGISE